MEKNINISMASLKRLPKYLRILKIKSEDNIKYISSTTIAEELKLNPIQVRKDLALVSKNDGKPGIGFEINELIENIEEYLGLSNSKNAIIVGAGKLGKALLNYNGFENNINITMAFDKDKKQCDNKKIFHIDTLKDKLKKSKVELAIITVPKESAQEVCNILVNCGIKAIWNFAQINLNVPENIVVKHEDLSASLLILLKKLEENEK